MPSKTNYADLTLYDGTLDADKNFRDFRVDIAGIGTQSGDNDTRSNFQKIDDILFEHIPDNAKHRQIYDISASKNSETENNVTYLATNVGNFNSLSNGMLFFLSVDETNAKSIVYLAINSIDNTSQIKKFNNSGQIVDLEQGDLIANVKYFIEYDNYQGSFILMSPITTKEILDKIGTLSIANGGTGATTALTALENFGITDAEQQDFIATDEANWLSQVQTYIAGKLPSRTPFIFNAGYKNEGYGTGIAWSTLNNIKFMLLYNQKIGKVKFYQCVDGTWSEVKANISTDDISAVPTARTINGKSLSGNIDLYTYGTNSPSGGSDGDIYFRYS